MSARIPAPQRKESIVIEKFRDDDRGYLTWTAAHGAGYVMAE
jgi:hypothetical protein